MYNWLEITCPNCKTTNWVDNGDITLLKKDQEGYQCWRCKKIFNLNGKEVDEHFIPGDPLPHLPYKKLIQLIGDENTARLLS
jgi:hypothetical protein